MATNPEENNQPEKWVSRKIFKSLMRSCYFAAGIILTGIRASLRHRIFKSIMMLCYLAGIILTGIGAELRNNSPNYENWIKTVNCGNVDLCGVVLAIAFSGIFEVLLISLFVSFILFIFFAYNRLYKILSKKFPNRCIRCLVIKFVFLLFLSYLLLLFIGGIIYGKNLKWGFYTLLLADIFIFGGMMIMFYLGLTLNKEPSSDNRDKDTFWA
jgi:hypothetical protein